jgi:hypothetical protein
MFALGGQLFGALKELPLVERMGEAGKALSVAKAHPELAQAVSRFFSAGGEAGTGTLAATGKPKEAAAAAAGGGALSAVAEPAAAAAKAAPGAIKSAFSSRAVQEGLANEVHSIINEVASKAGVEAPQSKSIMGAIEEAGEKLKALTRDSTLSDYEKFLGKTSRDQGSALLDVKAGLKPAVSGPNPDIEPGSKIPELSDIENFFKQMDKLHDSGKLQDALGEENADRLYHASHDAVVKSRSVSRARKVAGVAGTAAAVAAGREVVTGVKIAKEALRDRQ